MIMSMKNKYRVRSRIAEAKTREILKLCSASLTLVALQEALY